MSDTMSKHAFTTVSATKLVTHGTLPSMTVSTAAVDRDNDRVLPEGGNFKNFLNNPVLCWGHSRSDIPIGSVVQLSTDRQAGIRMQWKWLENDPFADRVKNAWEQGIVRAASIGFIPKQSVRNEFGGEDHQVWELLEISLCSVPANPTAVRALKSLGLWDAQRDDGEQEVDWDAINCSARKTDHPIDWASINMSALKISAIASGKMNRSIDWAAINGEEIDIDPRDVDRIIVSMVPAIVAGTRAGMREMAGQAAREAMNALTGRVD